MSKIFISHVTEDYELAKSIDKWLNRKLAGSVKVFISTDKEDGIRGGMVWWDKIREELRNAELLVVVISSRSQTRPWIYFESGGAYFAGIPTIPLIIDMEISDFKPPLNLFQAYRMNSSDDMKAFFNLVVEKFDRDSQDDGIEISQVLKEENEAIIKRIQKKKEEELKLEKEKYEDEFRAKFFKNFKRLP